MAAAMSLTDMDGPPLASFVSPDHWMEDVALRRATLSDAASAIVGALENRVLIWPCLW